MFNNLLEKSARLTNEPAISIYLAKEMKASCYGHVGVTAAASENLGVAIGILEQFIGLHCIAFQPKLYIEQEMAYLNFNQPLNNFKFNHHAIIFLVLGFAHILENLAQQNLDIQIELQGNSQDIFRNIDNSDGYRVNFGADEDRLIFNKELLNLPLKTADPLVFRLTKRQCEYDVSKLSKKNKS
ncbi:AraC family transcriptional regulator ligand-binding domain-containing protein [Acinetobacter modestus]|uniref:AraC family transcriptional regulator ligand-binding domain-containing protein n=1 Tax=Acinetobacter modestus TaxID=1776740 RepID=UPI003D182351